MQEPLNIDHLIADMRSANAALINLHGAYAGSVDIDAIKSKIYKVNEALEKAVISSRNVLEKLHNEVMPSNANAPIYPYMNISGSVRIIQYGWLHIKLNTLLPHCRYQTPKYLTDTIIKLLNCYESEKGKLPFYENAMMVIDEYNDIKTRKVFDQDNKGWKAVSNALKGRLFPDDDQFSLGIALVSSKSETPSCNIFIMNALDAGEFFNIRSEGSLLW